MHVYVITIVMHRHHIHFWYHFPYLPHNFLKVAETTFVQYFASILAHYHHVIFALIRAMPLFPNLHPPILPGRHGGRYIHGASPVVLCADKPYFGAL